MSKIYSRPRIKLPKVKIGKIKNKEKTRKIALIVIILIIAITTQRLIFKAILPSFYTLCESRAMSIATKISNEQATKVMREHSYEELFKIEKDNEGKVTMVTANTSKINEIISDVAIKIQEEIDKRGRDNIGIAFGSFTRVKMLSGRGPSVKIRISSAGEVHTDLKSEFIAKGINQTLHRVYLQVDCEIDVLTPFDKVSKNVSNQILIAENVIVGNIPSTYYNIEGLENKVDAMEVME